MIALKRSITCTGILIEERAAVPNSNATFKEVSHEAETGRHTLDGSHHGHTASDACADDLHLSSTPRRRLL